MKFSVQIFPVKKMLDNWIYRGKIWPNAVPRFWYFQAKSLLLLSLNSSTFCLRGDTDILKTKPKYINSKKIYICTPFDIKWVQRIFTYLSTFGRYFLKKKLCKNIWKWNIIKVIHISLKMNIKTNPLTTQFPFDTCTSPESFSKYCWGAERPPLSMSMG